MRTAKRPAVAALVVLFCGAFWLTGCGSDAGKIAASVGRHEITRGAVDHWISVLASQGNGGQDQAPPAPTPPDYKACVAYRTTHRAQFPGQAGKPKPTRDRLKALCAVEYRRLKLKALYLLISYQWVSGEAAELGVPLHQPELRRQVATYEQILERNHIPFQQYLSNIRARNADILTIFETEQLAREIEAKISTGADVSSASAQRALMRFGQAYKRRWHSRTDCRAGYIVPMCRQYRRPNTPPEFIPPSIPLTGVAESPAERIK